MKNVMEIKWYLISTSQILKSIDFLSLKSDAATSYISIETAITIVQLQKNIKYQLD